MRFASVKIKSTEEGSYKKHQKTPCNGEKPDPTNILPPHGPSQISTRTLKFKRRLIKPISLIHQ